MAQRQKESKPKGGKKGEGIIIYYFRLILVPKWNEVIFSQRATEDIDYQSAAVEIRPIGSPDKTEVDLKIKPISENNPSQAEGNYTFDECTSELPRG